MLMHDLTLFFASYLSLFLLQALALPAIFWVSKQLPFIADSLWGFGRIVGLLVLSLLVWHLAFWQLPVNSVLGVNLIFCLLLLTSLLLTRHFFWQEQSFLRQFLHKFKRVILVEELVFLLAALFLFAMRSFQPEILGLEKFMDAGFIQAYVKSPTLPAGDIWYATDTINYYSFGHFYQAVLLQLWQLELSHGYNLLLVFLLAIFSQQLFSIGYNLMANWGKFNYWRSLAAGGLTVLLVAFGGNGHTIWHAWQNQTLSDYWYPNATRFIDRTIHEFPAYSFVVSDLHAHVLALPVNLLLLILLAIWLKTLLDHQQILSWRQFVATKLIYWSTFMGVCLGVMVMTSTWDVMIYGLVLAATALLLLLKRKKLFWGLFFSALTVAVTMATLAITWFVHFSPIASGLKVAQEHSPLWQLAVLWLPHLLWAMTLLYLGRKVIFAKHRQPAFTVVLLPALFLVALVLLIFPELFYFADIYTTHPRANTMFKFVFQGFIFLGILSALAISSLQWHKHWLLVLLAIPFLYFSVLAYPYLAYRSYYGGWRNYQGLDGLAWLQRKHPDDYRLINYLAAIEPRQVNIVEAVGESYTEFARVSAFTGMPTILGWRVHEWLWRAGWDGPSKRTEEVAKIYQHPTSSEAQMILAKYKVKYLVLGAKETEAYPNLDVNALLSLGEVVFSSGNSYLVRLAEPAIN